MNKNSKPATTETARRFNTREGEVSVNILKQQPNSTNLVKISKRMQSIINHCSHFTAKPIGPIYACVKDKHIKNRLPSDFLNTYIVDCLNDSELLETLCQQHNKPVPNRIIYSFSEKRYDNLDKDPKADRGIIATLKEEDPTVSNVLVDHLNIHIMDTHLGKHFEQYKYFIATTCIHYLTDPDRAVDDYDDWFNVESPNGKWRNIISLCACYIIACNLH